MDIRIPGSLVQYKGLSTEAKIVWGYLASGPSNIFEVMTPFNEFEWHMILSVSGAEPFNELLEKGFIKLLTEDTVELIQTHPLNDYDMPGYVCPAPKRKRKFYSAKNWLLLKDKYNHTCLCCGRREPEIKLCADHVIPLASGGDDAIDNIQPLCRECNDAKGIKTIDYRSAEDNHNG
jgi:hypothetical protein